MDKNERIANIEIIMESQKNNLEFFIKYILEKKGYQDSEELGNKFTWCLIRKKRTHKFSNLMI